ncbi:MAG TPA: GFA family protein [Pseudomonadales bacterium]|nr:GFA family protein [Pseudomonadales bacterium]
MSDRKTATPLAGGCLCGAVRFRIRGAPRWVAICHCTSCRRAVGAVGVAWVGFMAAQVRFEGLEEHRFASSAGVSRGFCARCGTSLSYRSDTRPDTIDLTVGAFDEPERLPPERSVWVSDRVSWAAHLDGLPSHRTLGDGDADADGEN